MALRVPMKVSNANGKHRSNGLQPKGFLPNLMPPTLTRDETIVVQHIREGRFQRSLALITAFSSLLSGLEVTYEHYKGSYSQRIMYTPVIISLGLLIAGIWGAFNRWVARVILPIVSLITVVDGIVGFIFHIRGVNRK